MHARWGVGNLLADLSSGERSCVHLAVEFSGTATTRCMACSCHPDSGAACLEPMCAALAVPLLAHAQQQYTAEQHKVRLLAEGSYQAGSWRRARQIVYKAEVPPQETNTRFVVTTCTTEAAAL